MTAAVGYVLAFLLGLEIGSIAPTRGLFVHRRHRPSARNQRTEPVMPVMLDNPKVRRLVTIALMVVFTAVTASGVVTGLALLATRNTVAHQADELASLTASVADYQRCQSTYEQSFVLGYTRRADASLRTQVALDRIIQAVENGFLAPHDPANYQRMQTAVSRYVTVREHQLQQQQIHPIPPLPNSICGLAPAAKGK